MKPLDAAAYRRNRTIGPEVYADLEARCQALGVTIHGVSLKIGMDPSVPHRWRTGTTPSLATYLPLERAIRHLEAAARAEATDAP